MLEKLCVDVNGKIEQLVDILSKIQVTSCKA